MYASAGEPRFLQGMLRDSPIETGPRVAFEMRGSTIHCANRIHSILRLIFEDALLAVVDPGHTGLPGPST